MNLGAPGITREIGHSKAIAGQRRETPTGRQGRNKPIRRAYGEKRQKPKAPLTLSNASELLPCPACGRPFRPKRRTQRACRRPCYLALWHFEELKRAIAGGGAEALRRRIEELKSL